MIARQPRVSSPVSAVLLVVLLIAVSASGAEGPVASGRVTDLQGRPVAGALVESALGDGRSDAQGGFQILLSEPVKELSLTVEHPGFQRWSLYGASPDRDGLYQIRLTRTIGSEYLTELAAQTEPARFQWLARDLLTPSMGTVGETLPMEEVLPFLKTLRPWLRALLPAKPALVKQRDLPEQQHRAILLLAYLGDPQDDALVDAWASKQNFVARPPKPCQGATADTAAREWQKVHFAKEGYGPSQSVPYNTMQTQIAPSDDHGLVLHTVRYAHWGYSQYGVLVRLNDTWEVRRVIHHERWHGQ
jgi:hypothetical protein